MFWEVRVTFWREILEYWGKFYSNFPKFGQNLKIAKIPHLPIKTLIVWHMSWLNSAPVAQAAFSLSPHPSTSFYSKHIERKKLWSSFQVNTPNLYFNCSINLILFCSLLFFSYWISKSKLRVVKYELIFFLLFCWTRNAGFFWWFLV